MNRHYRHRRPLFSSRVPKDVKNPKIKWRILPIMWMALKRMAMLLGFMMLLSLTASLIFTYKILSNQTAPALPDEMVLYLNFDDGVRELPDSPSLADPFAAGGVTVHHVVEALDKAALDPRVRGVYARFSGGRFGLAHIQEMRAAVERFRASGKFAYAYSSSYGGEGGGFGGYYLASSFEEVWMQPLGVVSIPGINAEVPFLRDVLDKIGVEPQFFQRKEYKSAYESLSNSEMSPANELAMTALIEDIRGQFVSDISADRGLRPSVFEDLVDKGLFTARAALESGLITKSDYVDVLIDDLKMRVVGDVDADDSMFVTLGGYLNDVDRAPSGGLGGMLNKEAAPAPPVVAVVNAVGTIMPTNAGASNSIAAADEIAPAIWDAAEDDDVQAIILRVDSPGGSPSASESILRAVQKAQEKGKPVIVSMGPTAASGGYWIATSADQIFAMPTTLTGSIGVVGGKFSVRDLWTKIGVNWEAIKWGENSGIWSLNTPFSESEAEQISEMLDEVYEAFTVRVAAGRNMSAAQVEEVARGRVWSGKAAYANGLVDKLGGLKDAKDYVAELLGVESAGNLEFVTLPKPLSPLEKIIELLANQGMVMEGLKFQGRIVQALRPVAAQLGVAQANDPALIYETLRLD